MTQVMMKVKKYHEAPFFEYNFCSDFFYFHENQANYSETNSYRIWCL